MQDYATGTLESNMQRRAIELQGILANLGPSFAKVGQALSARPDLLPKPYLEALAQLQDQLPPFPTPVAMALIDEDLGRPVRLFAKCHTPTWHCSSVLHICCGPLSDLCLRIASIEKTVLFNMCEFLF